MLHFLDHEGGCLKEGKEEINEFPLIKANWNRFLRGRFGNKCLLYLIYGGWCALVFRLDQNHKQKIFCFWAAIHLAYQAAWAGEGGRGILAFRFSKRNVPNGGHSLIRTKKFSLQFLSRTFTRCCGLVQYGGFIECMDINYFASTSEKASALS